VYSLVTTKYFLKRSRKFFRKHPEVKPRFAEAAEGLKTDPFQPHLRLHPLKGQLKGLYSVSITYEHRITLTLKITEKEIILLDIGSHDEVYR
jgi:mRNA-degrading endonuclease YafQ of YafQ-DinJ toxin-antitoxin module